MGLTCGKISGFLPGGARVASFVGAGGKTSAIYSSAKQAASKNKRVIITTTTHMQYPDSEYLPLCTTWQEAALKLKHGGTAVCGIDDGCKNGIHKIKGMKQSDFDACCPASLQRICDLMLVESDGAAMMPLKVPLDTEPVIPVCADAVFVCAGMKSLQRPLREVCFRHERAEKLLGVDSCHIVTADDVSLLLFAGYIKPALKSKSAKTVVLLNQADSDREIDQAQIAARSLDALVKRHFGSVFVPVIITSFRTGLCMSPPL